MRQWEHRSRSPLPSTSLCYCCMAEQEWGSSRPPWNRLFSTAKTPWRKLMAGEDSDKTQAQASGNMPGPDVMLGLWASWMDQMSAPAKALADPGTTWWKMPTDNPASSLIAGGVDQLQT